MSNRNSFIESTKETDERLEALKQLYPEIFSDGKINLDAFKDVTGTSDLPEGQDRTPGYYGLYWPGKRAAKQLARKEAEGTLEPVPGDGVNEDTTHNIYIEGDNLEVLRILKQSYKGRVKMIYIDPPYNTGNDFIYPDDFKMPVEEYLKMTGQADESGRKLVTNLKSNGAFHTTWLNMMYSRLQIARELLTYDGLIFISINDSEQGNLKLLCDDIFGEENFLATLVWDKNHSAQAGIFKVYHEYILVYAKDINNVGAPKAIEHDLFEAGAMKKVSGRHPASEFTFPAGTRFDAPDGTILKGEYGDTEKVIVTKGQLIAKDGKLKEDVTLKAGFTQANQMKQYFYGDKETLVDTQGQKIVEFYFNSTGKIKIIKERGIEAPQTTCHYGTQGAASTELANLFDLEESPFSSPKPVSMLKDFIIRFVDDGDIVLDFFSGSATTAHGMFEANLQKKMNIKFIMVQMAEDLDESLKRAQKDAVRTLEVGIELLNKLKKPHTICEIGKERIRRAGAKILEEAKSNKDMFSEDNPLDVGFKVYRMISSNFKKYTPVSGQDKEAENSLFKELEGNLVPLVDGWKSENVLTEIILKQGFALDCTKEKVDSFKKNTIWKITDSADTVSKKIKLYVCLDNSIEEETIKNLTLNDDEKFICLDAAIDDSAYARLADKGRIETI